MDYSNVHRIVNWTGKPQPGWLPLAGVEVVDGGAVVSIVHDQITDDPENIYVLDGLAIAPKLPPVEDGVVHLLPDQEVAQYIWLVDEQRGDLFHA